MRLKLITFLPLLSVILTSCLRGPGLFKKFSPADEETVQLSPLDQGDGVLQGRYNPLSAANQVLGITSGVLSGASVIFPPGALLVPTDISVQEGGDLSSGALAINASLQAGFSAAGPTLNISANPAANSSQPMSLRLPLASLGLSDENLVVLYKVVDAATGHFFIGVLPSSEVTRDDQGVIIETKRFGSFQAVYSDRAILQKEELSSNTPIMTAKTEKALKPIVWTLNSASLSERKASWIVTTQGFSKLMQCGISVQDRFSGELLSSYEIVNLNSANPSVLEASFTESSGKAVGPSARFSCEDELGRSAMSDFYEAPALSALTPSNSAQQLFICLQAPSQKILLEAQWWAASVQLMRLEIPMSTVWLQELVQQTIAALSS